MFTLAPAVLAVAVSGVHGAPAAGTSSKQSDKAVFAATRARLIKESELAGQWTASSYGAGSSGGGSGGSGSSINVSQCHNVNEPGVDQNPYFVEGDYFDRKGTNAEIQEEIDVYPNTKQATKNVESPRVRLSNPATWPSLRAKTLRRCRGKCPIGGQVSLVGADVRYAPTSAEFRLAIYDE